MRNDMTALDRLCAEAEKEIMRSELIRPGEKVLVALSGGADSVALLYVLMRGAERLRLGGVFACHVNHGIRGSEADRDESFCRELCLLLGTELKTVHVDVPSESESTGEGLEECARRLRYSELHAAAKEFGCGLIATAHHADDNIETVLLHMIRGCGLRGLTGIPRSRDNIVRPLLSFSKRMIVEALESEGIPFVCDSTNSDLDMARNLLRHTVLPQIYKLNPSADVSFRRMCESLLEDEAFIDKTVEAMGSDLDRNALAALDRAVLSRLVRRLYTDFGGEGQLEREQVAEICRAVRKNRGSWKSVLPGSITVHVDAGGISFSRESMQSPDYFIRLRLGENNISSYGYKILITPKKNVAIKWKNIYKLSILTSVISDKILCGDESEVYIRPRRAGDRYVFGGMGRDVRRQMINFRIPEYRRRTLPCFTDAEGNIFFIPGLPTADDFRPGQNDSKLYVVFADENNYK